MLSSLRRSAASACAQSPRYSKPGMISDGNLLAVLAFVEAVQMIGTFCCSTSNLRNRQHVQAEVWVLIF